MIRPLNIATDSADLIRLHLSINPDELESEILDFYKNYAGDVFVLENEQKIVGFIALSKCLWNKISIIEEIAVNEEFRNRGFGKELLDFVLEKSKQRGDRFITVQTATWNTDGIRFYERGGFTQKATFSQYFGEDIDMIWLDIKLEKR